MRWVLPVLAGCSFAARSPGTTSDGPPRDVVSQGDGHSGDAALIDAPDAIDFVIEAEAYTDVVATTSHAWTLQTTVAGASAGEYVQITPNDGAACDPVSTIAAGCPTWVDYVVNVPVQTTYHVHVRMYAAGAADDSVWYGIDGTPDATNLAPTHDSMWHWVSAAATHTLAPGMHTLTLWQREAGARVDVVALTQSATPPP